MFAVHSRKHESTEERRHTARTSSGRPATYNCCKLQLQKSSNFLFYFHVSQTIWFTSPTQKGALQSSTAVAKIYISRKLKLPQTVTKAAGPAPSFAHLCKADAACRNEAVWYNTELKVQFCDAHRMEGENECI